MDIKKLKIARKKIDKLDNNIFNLIKKRTQVVKYMLSLKKFKSRLLIIRELIKYLKILEINLLKIK